MPDDLKRTLVAAAVLGLTAGAVVWFLERFERERMFRDMYDMLDKHDKFRAFLQEGRQGDTSV